MRNVKTPSELNREARIHLEAGLGRVWVEGEISNLSRPASGHLYFSLKDDKAQVSCALFRREASQLAFRPDNGQQVLAHGRVSLYEPSGRYQLILESLEAAGEGRLRAAFDALKKQLEAEGLFDPAAKKPLPAAPKCIGVITSPSGAVIRDILHVLRRRWPLAAVRLYPVPVQGNDAAPAIVRALESANRHGWADALILGRGGGSLEDLWAFNEEIVARAIANSGIPVVSAVGHETDFSISDFVADHRAPTPSAAAEILTPDQSALARSLDNVLSQLTRRWMDGLARRSQSLDHLGHRLAQQHPGRRMERLAERLVLGKNRLRTAGARVTTQREQALQTLLARLQQTGVRMVPERQGQLHALARTLHAVSPLPTLERGYAVVTDQDSGQPVTRTSDTRKGATISTRFSDGRVVSHVASVHPDDPAGDPSA